MADATIKNMEEFAAVSGISRPTLSKYFNNPESVRKSTRAKIEAALEQYAYRPNVYAVNQNRRHTKNIGLIVPNLTDPFFGAIARVIEGIIIHNGFTPLLLSSHAGPEGELENLKNLISLKPAGILLAPLGRASRQDDIAELCRGIPTVLFDANLTDVGEAFVGSDNGKSISLMVDYLCRSGEPPIFFEMKDPINPNALKRRDAYTRAMEAIGHTPNLVQVEGDSWDFEKIGFEGASDLFEQDKITSNTILCSNDRIAIGVLSAAYQKGLKVGHTPGCHFRVAGHDDHPYAKYTCPALTTVSQDYEEIAKSAVSSLLATIESEDDERNKTQKLFTGRLILRDSA